MDIHECILDIENYCRITDIQIWYLDNNKFGFGICIIRFLNIHISFVDINNSFMDVYISFTDIHNSIDQFPIKKKDFCYRK